MFFPGGTLRAMKDTRTHIAAQRRKGILMLLQWLGYGTPDLNCGFEKKGSRFCTEILYPARLGRFLAENGG